MIDTASDVSIMKDTIGSKEVSPTASVVRHTRFAWPRATPKLYEDDEGVTRTNYPFLHDGNTKDFHFVQLLYVEKPYSPMIYGESNWETFHDTLLKVQDDEGKLIFQGLSIRSVQQRYKAIIKIAKTVTASVPRQTGQDDQIKCVMLGTLDKILMELYLQENESNQKSSQNRPRKQLEKRLPKLSGKRV